jgi:hypothetical protein
MGKMETPTTTKTQLYPVEWKGEREKKKDEDVKKRVSC